LCCRPCPAARRLGPALVHGLGDLPETRALSLNGKMNGRSLGLPARRSQPS
jgi:hypothetical protein